MDMKASLTLGQDDSDSMARSSEIRRDLLFGIALLLCGITLSVILFPRLEASQTTQNQPVGLLVFSFVAVVVIIVGLMVIGVNWRLLNKRGRQPYSPVGPRC